MPAMGALLTALAAAVRATATSVLAATHESDVGASLALRSSTAGVCKLAASRRARLAIEHDGEVGDDLVEGEWLNYAALLVQVDRIVADLSATASVSAVGRTLQLTPRVRCSSRKRRSTGLLVSSIARSYALSASLVRPQRASRSARAAWNGWYAATASASINSSEGPAPGPSSAPIATARLIATTGSGRRT